MSLRNPIALAIGAIILLILTSALNLILPEGLLQNHFYDRLPWPLVS